MLRFEASLVKVLTKNPFVAGFLRGNANIMFYMGYMDLQRENRCLREIWQELIAKQTNSS